MKLRIAGYTEESVVDGPGIRFVIYAQGCPHRCTGCQYPCLSLYCSDGLKHAKIKHLHSQPDYNNNDKRI